MFKEPFFALFEMANSKSTSAGTLLFSYRDEDKEGYGWKLLEENLQVVQHNSGMYMIRFYETLNKAGTIDSNTPYTGSFKLRMNNPEELSFSPAKGAAAPSALLNELFASKLELFDIKWDHKFQEQERLHQEEVAELQAQLEEKDQLPEDRFVGTVGAVHQWGQVVGELGNQFPWMRELIVKLGSNVNDMLTVGKYKMTQTFGPQAPPARPGAATGGIGKVDAPTGTAAQRLDTAVITLLNWYASKHGDTQDKAVREAGLEDLAADMELLANMTTDDDVMNLALTKLRKLA
jgi:hypothetical protein